ncbi:hypothetical protein [Saccharothrix sp. NRRL B-16348]|uniref:hypothetical protein n=1 Tax=Saccharothrix sp. NRRL B-16348 TaxID=1415542 RepID=UPI000AD07C27|nr:hypothetical protein [Saccharothrix sp. NRRL B-16348]
MTITRRAVLVSAAACVPEHRATPTAATSGTPPPEYPTFQAGVLTPPPASSTRWASVSGWFTSSS